MTSVNVGLKSSSRLKLKVTYKFVFSWKWVSAIVCIVAHIKYALFLSANQLCWHPTTLDICISSWVVLLFLTVRLKVISTFWSERCLQFVYCCWVFILVLFSHLVSWIEKFLNAIIVTLKIHVLLVVENYSRAKFARLHSKT